MTEIEQKTQKMQQNQQYNLIHTVVETFASTQKFTAPRCTLVNQ